MLVLDIITYFGIIFCWIFAKSVHGRFQNPIATMRNELLYLFLFRGLKFDDRKPYEKNKNNQTGSTGPRNALNCFPNLHSKFKCIIFQSITNLNKQNGWSQGKVEPFFVRENSDEVRLEHPGRGLGVSDALEGDGGVVAEVLGHYLLPTGVEPQQV